MLDETKAAPARRGLSDGARLSAHFKACVESLETLTWEEQQRVLEAVTIILEPPSPPEESAP